MSKLEFKVTGAAPKMAVKLIGSIDEDTNFSQIALAGCTELELDLEHVKSINSCGIREWIKWLSAAPSIQYSLKNCPKVIVDQINLVDGFLPKQAKVLSFFVPYFNEDEGSEKNVLFKYGTEFKEGQLTPPAKVTDDSGHEMELDVIEAKYFAFISKM